MAEDYKRLSAEEADQASRDQAAEQNQAVADYVEAARAEQAAPEVETEEAFWERRADVVQNSPLLFGSVDTSGTLSAESSLTETPSADVAGGRLYVAQKDAAAEAGDEDAAATSDEEARRQAHSVDVDEAAQADADRGGGGFGDTAHSEEGVQSEEAEESLSRQDVIDRVRNAESVEEVDRLVEGDDRSTVTKAADKRREELNQE